MCLLLRGVKANCPKGSEPTRSRGALSCILPIGALLWFLMGSSVTGTDDTFMDPTIDFPLHLEPVKFCSQASKCLVLP